MALSRAKDFQHKQQERSEENVHKLEEMFQLKIIKPGDTGALIVAGLIAYYHLSYYLLYCSKLSKTWRLHCYVSVYLVC
jgi:hypothetical protein